MVRPQYVYVDMDKESTNFHVFIINMRENYSSGLMLKHKVVYLLYTTQEFEWNKLGQRRWTKLS